MQNKITLLLLAPAACASLYSPFFPYDLWQVPVHYNRAAREVTSRGPTWTSTQDAYVMKIRVPPLEPDSVTAKLMADEAILEISAKRSFEGCECAKRVFESVPLPYRPRAEDIHLELSDDFSQLDIRLARKAKATTPVSVEVKKAVPPEAVEGTRPIRFIPHASAAAATTAADDADAKNAPSVEDRERSLTAKFAEVVKSAKEAAAATAEEDKTVSASAEPAAATNGDKMAASSEPSEKPAAKA